MRVVNRIEGSSKSILMEVFVTRSATEWSGDVREAMRIQLTSNRFRPVPGSGHSFLFQAIPFPSVVEVLFPKSIA